MPGEVIHGPRRELFSQIAVNLLRHALGDDDRQTYLIHALDAAQDLFRSEVSLDNIPAPTSSDPRLRALAACTLERLVEVWATPPHDRIGEQAPSWCAVMLPLPEPLWLIDRTLAEFWLNPIFAKRNIMALTNFLMFV